jgi:hypothetical protein
MSAMQQIWRFPHNAGIEQFQFEKGNKGDLDQLIIKYTSWEDRETFFDLCDLSQVNDGEGPYAFSCAGGPELSLWHINGEGVVSLLSALEKMLAHAMDASEQKRALICSMEGDAVLTLTPSAQAAVSPTLPL